MQNEMKKLSVLVVEDHLANRMVLESLLDELGYEATLVETGRAALDRVRSERFDVLLLDCSLPDIDGYTVAAMIRAEEASSERYLPIIAVSATVGEQHVEACLVAGIDGVLPKPIQLLELREMIEMWVDCDAASALLPSTHVQDVAISDMSLLSAFFYVASADLIALERAFSQGNADVIAGLAHRIVGSALAMGFDQIVGLARSVESKARQQLPLSALEVDVQMLVRCLAEKQQSLQCV